ncbi:MAG TPA: Uma2 family endonuclease [Planctomycetaceae bacterium]|jgi:Uma2 family endonuclease|nr:Uma2 family endonuclease [Planctomycetaceae bacterium]
MRTKPHLHLGVADHDLKLTRDEFAEAHYDEPWRYERVQGRLFVMSPAGHDHQRPNNRIRDYLGAYSLAHPEVVDCVFSEAWIAVDKGTDRIVDIGVYLLASRRPEQTPDQPPDIAFEIVSGGGEDRKRDYVDKRADYLRAGVREYVIVDRFEQRVTVLRRSRGRFVESQLGPKDNYTTPLLPGLRIPLKEII